MFLGRMMLTVPDTASGKETTPAIYSRRGPPSLSWHLPLSTKGSARSRMSGAVWDAQITAYAQLRRDGLCTKRQEPCACLADHFPLLDYGWAFALILMSLPRSAASAAERFFVSSPLTG